jgi:hypothetical protein
MTGASKQQSVIHVGNLSVCKKMKKEREMYLLVFGLLIKEILRNYLPVVNCGG